MPARARASHASRSSNTRSTRARSTGVVFMLVNTLCWGGALAISKFAVEDTSAFFFLLYRFGFAALFSVPLLFSLWKKVKPRSRDIAEIVALELLGTTLCLGLLYWGLSLTTSLEASLLTMTIPLFVTIGGILFLQEKEARSEWMGLGLALAGTLLLTLEPLFSGRTNGQLFTSVEGNLFILVSNLAAAAYYLLAKRRYARYPKLFATSVSFWVGTLSFLFLAFFLSASPADFFTTITHNLANPAVLWPSLYMATFGSIIGLTAYIKGQDSLEASEASLFTYLQPAVSIPLAFFLHLETPTWMMLGALLIIGAGVGTAELPRWQYLLRTSVKNRRTKKAHSTRK